MRPVSDAWKNSIYENRKALLLKADMLLLTGETLYLDYEDGDDDFMADGLTFEDATSNESSFDIGNAVMNTFSFRLNNANDKYTNKILTDAVITPYVGMELSDGETEWVKRGKFIVSDPGKRGSILSFTAYDFMQKLEIAFSSVKITYPVTIGKMAQAICTACGVTLATTTFPNSTYVISEAPAGSNYSCRQMISFIAQIAGCFARFNADGELEIKWYEAVDTENQNYHDISQYKTLETELKDITITGVRVSSYYNESSLADENGNPVVENAESGSEGYTVSISNNPLIPYGKASQVANMLADAIVGTTFRPLNLTTFYDPSMEAGDTAVITDIKGNTYSFFVTNMTAKVGSDVKIICSAQTESDNLAEQYTGAAQVILSILEATNAKFKDLATNHLEALVGEFGYMTAEEAAILYLTADEAAIKYATITDLNATNATIQNLTAIAITTKNLEAEVAALGYATIDFANIDTAHINREKVKELFVEIGMIKDAVISEGHITGYLDAVKVNANDIKTGTLSTDRLIINGSDKSIVFALNNMGALVSTSVDSLDGGILTERTVTADKLVAHTITATEITTENIIGANGWINLALGTFNYGNKLSWDGKNLEIVGAVTIASLTTEALNTIKGYSTDAVNNLEIGGRNYILSSDVEKSITRTTSDIVTNYSVSDAFNVLENMTFVVSFDAKASVDGLVTELSLRNSTGSFYSDRVNSSPLTTEYKRYSVMLTLKSDYTPADIKKCFFALRKEGSVYIKNVQLEDATKASSYNLAPEDIDQSISEASIKNWCVNGNTTYIDGAKIYTGSITADKISVDSLEAIVAKIGGFSINDTALYNGTDSMTSTTAGVYVGSDGLRTVQGTNYVNMADGCITVNNTETPEKMVLEENHIIFYGSSDGTTSMEVGRLSPTGSKTTGIFKALSLSIGENATYFMIGKNNSSGGSDLRYMVNEGANPNGITQRHIFSGTMYSSGSIYIANGTGFNTFASDGTAVSLTFMSSSDYMYFGNSSYRTYLRGNAIYLTGGTTYFGGSSCYVTTGGTAKFGAVNASYIELSMSTPFIDFHYGSSTADWVMRVINDAENRLTVASNGDSTADLRVQASVATSTSYEARVTVDKGGIQGKLCISASNNFGIYSNYSGKWVIYSNTSGTVTCASSDKRLKNDLGNMAEYEALTVLRGIDIKNFTFKADEHGIVQNGIFAQDLRDVLINSEIGYRPYLVIESKDEEDSDIIYDLSADEEKVQYSIDYSKFTPLLWKGWQYHDDKISELEEQLRMFQAVIDKQAAEITMLKQQIYA